MLLKFTPGGNCNKKQAYQEEQIDSGQKGFSHRYLYFDGNTIATNKKLSKAEREKVFFVCPSMKASCG